MLDRVIQTPPHDEHVPLAAKLSPQMVLSSCAAHVGDAVGRDPSAWTCCRVLDVLYHPGRYLTAAFALVEDDSTTPDRFWADGQVFYLRQPVRFPVSARGRVIEIEGRAAELYTFPNDRRLRDLRKITSREALSELWGQAFAQGGGGEPQLQRQLLRYVPEKKCLARVKARSDEADSPLASRGVALRVSSQKLAERIARGHRYGSEQARSMGDALRLPDCVYAQPDAGITAIEWVKGRPLLELLSTDESDNATSKTSEALRVFHRLQVPGLEPVSPSQQCGFVRLAVEELCLATPEHADRLSRLNQHVCDMLSTNQSGESTTIHNDFYFDQVLVRSKGCVLVDLERVSLGDPLIDVANYAVQMRMLAHRPEFGVSADPARRCAAAFLEHYTDELNRPGAEQRCCAYGAVSLIALARAMIRHLRPGWPTLVEQCLNEAETLILSETTKQVSS